MVALLARVDALGQYIAIIAVSRGVVSSTLIAMLSASSRLPSMLSRSASMQSTQQVFPATTDSALRSSVDPNTSWVP